jgi:hypothetical protein
MSFVSSRAVVRPVVLMAAVILSLIVGGPAAQAKPPVRPGLVQALAASVTKPAGAYQLASTWTASSHTTSYRVKLTNTAGTVLDSATVADPAWTATTSAPASSVVTVTVTPYNGTRKGRPATTSKTLPDLTAPTGSFGVTEVGLVGTVTQNALSDDVSPADSISRSIDWGDGSAVQAWTSSTSASIDHSYAAQGRYLPSVTLVDLAGNSATVALDAIVILDTTAPTGSFSATPAAGWASYTKVALTQLTLSDDFSPAPFIQRSVVWGDGVVTQWASGTTLTHVYTLAGTYTPTVVAADEAGNHADLAAAPVTITKDTAGPAVRLRLPATNRAAVRSWLPIKGVATDAGVGVRVVWIKAVEKRGTAFYAYRPVAKTWVRAGTRQAGAWSKAGLIRVVPTVKGNWQVRLAKLKLGTLTYRVTGVDRVSNKSKTLVHSQKLTRW